MSDPCTQTVKHAGCPKCGSPNFAQWCIGWQPHGEHSHDPNQRRCACGHTWFIPCPTCGKTVR